MTKQYFKWSRDLSKMKTGMMMMVLVTVRKSLYSGNDKNNYDMPM